MRLTAVDVQLLRVELEELNWTGVSAEAFQLIKSQYELESSTWVFHIDTPDPDESELNNAAGSAAFMLRRIQALRYLLRRMDNAPAHLLLGQASELKLFIDEVLSTDLSDVHPHHGELAYHTFSRLSENLEAIITAAFRTQLASAE